MAISKIPSAGFQDNVKFRNIIINGDMSISQRSTSVSGITGSTFGYFTVDRWRIGVDNLGTWTMSQDGDVPTGQGFAKSLKLDCTTADASPSASDALFLNTNFEGQMLQYLKKGTSNAESLTLSFWVKSNKTGTYTISLDDNDNNRNIVGTYVINSANTWEKKTLTFAGDTTGAFDNDNQNSLRFYFWLGVGSNYNSGTLATSWENTVTANLVSSSNVNLADSISNYINITGVQLEAGQTASEFEFLPFDINQQRCFRYYERYQGTGGNRTTFSIGIKRDTYSGSDASVSGILNYRVRKRGSVTITYNASNNYSYSYGVTGDQFFSSYSFANIRQDYAVFNGELGTGVTNSGGIIHMREETSKFTAIDSEL
jgi:hypothetical protein